MAKITLELINEELKEYGWKCISDSYKNLDSELEFKCDEGHLVRAPWKKIRNKHECPRCRENNLKEKVLKVEPKKKGVKRILAIDQATYTCGWSIFDGKELVRYGTFSTQLKDEIARDSTIKDWMLSMIDNWQPDVVGLEGIQYQDESSGQKASVTVFQALARLQGILMEACYDRKIEYVVCPTNTWRHHCGVTGRYRTDKKRSMQRKAKEWHDITVTDDEADAIGIGRYVADLYNIQVVNWE